MRNKIFIQIRNFSFLFSSSLRVIDPTRFLFSHYFNTLIIYSPAFSTTRGCTILKLFSTSHSKWIWMKTATRSFCYPEKSINDEWQDIKSNDLRNWYDYSTETLHINEIQEADGFQWRLFHIRLRRRKLLLNYVLTSRVMQHSRDSDYLVPGSLRRNFIFLPESGSH